MMFFKKRRTVIFWIMLIVFSAGILTCSNKVNAPAGSVYWASIDDATINPATASYIKRCIDKAGENNAQCLIIKLDTPGGLLTSTRDIIKKITNSKVPVVVYVAPRGARAGSAGFFITLASHVAAMAPMTNIGAAHPVDLIGGNKSDKDSSEDKNKKDSFSQMMKRLFDKDFQTTQTQQTRKTESSDSNNPMEDKILNDTVAWVKTIAIERGRNVDWAIDAVVKSASIHEKEALEKKVIDLIANDMNELLEKLDGKKIKLSDNSEKTIKTAGNRLVEINFNLADQILNIIAHPNIAYILMMLGTLGLIFEVTHPGIAVPGVLGAICMILGLFALQVLPVNYAGLLLIILAIILFIAEVKVISYGLLSLGGIVCFFLGSLMMFDSSIPELRISMSLIIFFTIFFSTILLVVFTLVFKSAINKPLTGNNGMLGLIGEVTADIENEGKIFVHGEIWNAISEDGSPIKKGSKAEVKRVKGFTLIVKKTD